MVCVYKLSKLAHFLAIVTTITTGETSTQRAFYIKKKPEKINIYIPLFAVPFGRRNLQFICNANKVILAWEDARKRRKCVEAEGLESKIIILFATS